MSKKRALILTATLLYLMFGSPEILAQSETQKVEVGVRFSVIRLSNFDSSLELFRDRFPQRSRPNTIDLGVGGRFSYNIIDNFALDVEVNFFPQEDTFEGGRKTQVLFGPKVGVRNEKVGVFAKVRPDLIHFSEFLRVIRVVEGPFGVITEQRGTANNFFALDLGGVFEVYPLRRIILRFDVGDTIVHYRSLSPRELNPSFTRHNLQFNTGFGIRF